MQVKNWFRLLSIMPFLLLSACSGEVEDIALGSLERDRVTLSATETQIITSIAVEEGERVKEGQTLLTLDDEARQASVAMARDEVARASSWLEQLKNGARKEEIAAAEAGVAKLKATIDFLEKDFKRAQELVETHVSGQARLDKAAADLAATRADLERAAAQLALLRAGSRPEAITQAEAALAAAQQRVRQEEKALKNLTIIATRDGIVDALPWHKGGRVNQGAVLVVLLSGEAPYVRAYVPADEKARLRVGQRLMVRVEGQGEPYQGTLRKIRSEPSFTPYYGLNQKDRSRLMYLTEVQLDDAAAALPTGIPAQVILPARKDATGK